MLELQLQAKPELLRGEEAFSFVAEHRAIEGVIGDDLELDFPLSHVDLLSSEEFLPDIRTRRRILPVAKFKTDEDLSLALSPLQYRGCLEVLLIRHLEFMQHALIGLQSITDHPQQLLVVELLVVV